MSYTSDNRFEIPDPVPVAKPVGWQAPPSLQEQIRRLIRTEMSMRAAAEGRETFEEADDFDVPDEDPDPVSPYTLKEATWEGPVDASNGPRSPDQGGVKGEVASPPQNRSEGVLSPPAPAAPPVTNT